jgi:flagellar FliJ protein
MPATNPLDVLLEAARLQRDGEAKRLAHDLADARAAEDRLVLLERYRHDYEMRLRERAALGLTGDEWRNYRLFLGQLDAAMQAQRDDLAARREAADSRRGAWSAARQRVRSFERLHERRESEQRTIDDRRTQAALDEQALRGARHAHARH